MGVGPLCLQHCWVSILIASLIALALIIDCVSDFFSIKWIRPALPLASLARFLEYQVNPISAYAHKIASASPSCSIIEYGISITSPTICWVSIASLAIRWVSIASLISTSARTIRWVFDNNCVSRLGLMQRSRRINCDWLLCSHSPCRTKQSSAQLWMDL